MENHVSLKQCNFNNLLQYPDVALSRPSTSASALSNEKFKNEEEEERRRSSAQQWRKGREREFSRTFYATNPSNPSSPAPVAGEWPPTPPTTSFPSLSSPISPTPSSLAAPGFFLLLLLLLFSVGKK